MVSKLSIEEHREEALKYVAIYSQIGLEDFVLDTENRIKELKRRMNDTGKTWTKSRIESWVNHHQGEIDEELEKLETYKLALKIKLGEV